MRYSMADVRKTYKVPDTWWGGVFMSHLSGRVTWLAANFTPFPPEVYTVLTLVLALVAWPYFLAGDSNSLLIGALFALLSDIIDGVNGKLARLYGVGNALGGYLDTTFDFIKSVGFLVCLPLGQFTQYGDTGILWLGVFCTLSYIWMFSNENHLGRIRAYLPAPPSDNLANTTVQNKANFFSRRGLLPAPGGSELNALMFMLGPAINQVEPCLLIGGTGYLLYSIGYTARLLLQTRGLQYCLPKDAKRRETA